MFYRAVFGMTVSGDTLREMSAISVGDGYTGMTLIPRRGGRKAGLDHFGVEVKDLEKVREKVAKKYPDIEIVKRPGNRPFASYSAHDPAVTIMTCRSRATRTAPRSMPRVSGSRTPRSATSRSGCATSNDRRLLFDVYELERCNINSEEGGGFLTDGR